MTATQGGAERPTDAQIIAALEWSLEWMRKHNVDGLSPFKDYPPVKETIAGMYRAMIAAAPSPDSKLEAYRKALESASYQCGNVIFNCEQRPADNDRHLQSWHGVKDFLDAALKDLEARP